MQDIKSEEELSEWVKTQFQKANQHLAEKGVLFESVVTQDSRYLAPFVAVWKIKDLQGKFYWVISGDVPSDFVGDAVAKDARTAIKHFSMQWQLTAENIQRATGNSEEQDAFAQRLIKSAENLYQLAEDNNIWQQA